jgi:hypothetical protein
MSKAQGLLESGDVAGLLRYLRTDGDALPLGEVAALVAGAGRLAGFDDLEVAGAEVAHGAQGMPESAALWLFGYACMEHGAGYLAIRPLSRALELAPDSAPILSELVTALEQDGRHARAVAVLEEHESRVALGWQQRYLYVYNAVMAGRLDKATEGFGRLPEPEDPAWSPAREKVRRMLARAGTVRGVTALDHRDLRGWHFVLTGGVLSGLSPYGFDVMTGRWGYVADSAGSCAAALARLRLILDAAGAHPESVALLPDRSSRILGAAAAMVLGLPAAEFDPASPAAGQLVVAYDLNGTDPDAVAALRRRLPGQVLFERATCWTDPPRITADITGLLAQAAAAPWAGKPYPLEDGTIGYGPADDRAAETIGAEIAHTTPERDQGDGATPADPDEDLRRFAGAVTGGAGRERDGGWLGGVREYVPDAGPVPSSRFL